MRSVPVKPIPRRPRPEWLRRLDIDANRFQRIWDEYSAGTGVRRYATPLSSVDSVESTSRRSSRRATKPEVHQGASERASEVASPRPSEGSAETGAPDLGSVPR